MQADTTRPAQAAQGGRLMPAAWRDPRLGGWSAILLAALPLLVPAAVIAIQRPDAFLDGDQALDEMALLRALHLQQLVGNYSRFGWDHPGPSWFYASDLVYGPLGGTSWAFYVAVLVLHALFAALIVATMWRFAGAAAAWLTLLPLLLYLEVLGANLWRFVWPPFAPILPMALLFPLAAWGAVRSTPAAVAAMIAGSYAVQTHVGTTLTVAVVLVAMAGVRVLYSRRLLPLTGEHVHWRRASFAGMTLLALLWLPVAVDELAGQHNLTRLVEFFTASHPPHGWHESLSILARLLAVYPFGHLPDLLRDTWLPMPASAWLTLAVFLGLVAGLFGAGRKLDDRFAQALSLLLAAAFPALVFSIKHVVGNMYPYFLVWTTALPLVLAMGWLGLPRTFFSGRRWSRPAGGLVALAALLLAGLVARDLLALRSPALEQYDPDSRQAWALTSRALAAERPQPIVIDITDDDRIPMAAAIALQLEKEGWTIRVNHEWNYIFGPDSVVTGDARVELVLVDPKDQARYDELLPDKRAIGQTSNTLLYLRQLETWESP